MKLADLSPEARAALAAKALHGAWHPRGLRRVLAEFGIPDPYRISSSVSEP